MTRPAWRPCWSCSRSTTTATRIRCRRGDRDAKGLLVACLRATGRPVYPVNPMAVARYRDRHSVAGRKSDKGAAAVLANVLRTDLHAYRPLPADSELAQAVAVLAAQSSTRVAEPAILFREVLLDQVGRMFLVPKRRQNLDIHNIFRSQPQKSKCP
jgi:Transposase